MTFGLTVTLEWWQWLLMVLAAGLCWGFGTTLGASIAGRLVAAGGRKT